MAGDAVDDGQGADHGSGASADAGTPPSSDVPRPPADGADGTPARRDGGSDGVVGASAGVVVVISSSRILADALAHLLTAAGLPARTGDPGDPRLDGDRIAAVLVDARDREEAREILERATELAPDAPGYVLLADAAVPEDVALAGGPDVAGTITRRAAPKELVALIRDGRPPREVVATGSGSQGHDPLGALTQRQREVLQHLAGGASGPEVAVRLGISEHTVRTHVQHILDRLNVSSRLEAVAVGVERGITEGTGRRP